ncbi:MAG: YigZ family protein [Actinomycetaceae bacterium]|nr:YigZ family protein [Actinomycetaceae bacterium]
MRSVRSGTWLRHEIEIHRSRFITTVAHTPTEEDARTLIATVRDEFPDATHNCSAFVVKPDDRNEIGHSNDDGEPSGTAGAPMLDVLRRRELVNVTAVVTRYFGGTLLGAGGLIRAYSTSVSETLDRADIVEIRQLNQWLLSAPHSFAGRIESELRNRGFHIVGVDYLDTARITCATEPTDEATFSGVVAEISGGTVSPTPLPPTSIEVDVPTR